MMEASESPDGIEYIQTEAECKDWTSEEVEELNSSLKICCIPLPRRLNLFAKYVAPTLLLFGSFFVDVYSDVAVAMRHYIDGHYWWFSLTLLFICAPAVMFIIQLRTNKNIDFSKKIVWILLYIFTGAGFFFWPLWGYFKRLYYVLQAFFDKGKSIEHLENYHSAAENNDNLQKLFKAFLQSAPQLLLQLYIIFSTPSESLNSKTVAVQVISVLFSLNALTIVVVHFELNSKHHSSRAPTAEQRQDVGDLCSVIIEYCWWFYSITARVLALALFASVFKFWVFLICALHSCTISACLFLKPSGHTLKSFVTSVFMGLIYIFCFIEYKVDFSMFGRVIGLYLVYYCFTFCQNVCMVLSVYFLDDYDSIYRLPVTVVHFLCFFAGVLFMLLYLGVMRPFYVRFMLIRTKPPTA